MLKKVFLLGIFLVAATSISQVEDDVMPLIEVGVVNIQENFIATQERTPAPAAGNVVFVEQIGLDNFLSIQVTSSQSNVAVFQTGTENFVDLNYTAAQINALVVQNGDNNSVTDYSFDPTGVVNTLVTQNGDNLNVQKYGSNSISNGLQINQTGSFKTIIVNSF